MFNIHIDSDGTVYHRLYYNTSEIHSYIPITIRSEIIKTVVRNYYFDTIRNNELIPGEIIIRIVKILNDFASSVGLNCIKYHVGNSIICPNYIWLGSL